MQEEKGADVRTLTPEPVPRPTPPEVMVRSSVERGRGPPPGVYAPPFFWTDVVEGPVPRRKARGEGVYVVYHSTDMDVDTRITLCTVVSVDPGRDINDHSDTVVDVESRISVQHRLFLEWMYKEQAFMERKTNWWRERIVSGLVRQRHAAKALPYRWMRRSALAAIRGEGRFALGIVNGIRGASRWAVETPDKFYHQWIRASGHLRDRMGRQSLWKGMRNPHNLSTEQKGVVLFLSASILFGAIFLLNNLVPLFLPDQWAIAYNDLLRTFILGFATAVVLPFPPSEGLVIHPYFSAGPAAAFLAITLSKVAGAWMVFFIGDALHSMIEEQTDGRPRMKRAVDWMHRNSKKYGAPILAAFTAAPFLPDTLALYVFAVSGMSFRAYLAGAVVGTVIRYAGVVGVIVFLGPERLSELLSLVNPFD